MKKQLAADVLFLAGALVIIYGLDLIHPVLAVLAAGAALIALGLLMGSSDRRKHVGG
jgi:hypothetical protein